MLRPVHHRLKRLDHSQKQYRISTGTDVVACLLKEIHEEKSVNHIVKYFDYPLNELLIDQSTDSFENTAQGFVATSSSIDNDEVGRFANHYMTVRRGNGETTMLRPQADPVQSRGFVSAPRLSPFLPPGQSLPTDGSVSVFQKMSQQRVTSNKSSHRHPRNYNRSTHESNFTNFTLSRPTVFHPEQELARPFFDVQQPPALMSIIPEFLPNPPIRPNDSWKRFDLNPYDLSQSSFEIAQFNSQPMYDDLRFADNFYVSRTSLEEQTYYSSMYHRTNLPVRSGRLF